MHTTHKMYCRAISSGILPSRMTPFITVAFHMAWYRNRQKLVPHTSYETRIGSPLRYIPSLQLRHVLSLIDIFFVIMSSWVLSRFLQFFSSRFLFRSSFRSCRSCHYWSRSLSFFFLLIDKLIIVVHLMNSRIGPQCFLGISCIRQGQLTRVRRFRQHYHSKNNRFRRSLFSQTAGLILSSSH